MNKKLKNVLLLVFFISLFFVVPVQAKKSLNDSTSVLSQTLGPTGLNTLTKMPQTVPELLGFWIKIALSLVGVIFFILMFYAGFKWMTARGQDEEIKKAQQTIIMAVIGLVIIISGYAITNFVVERVVEGQTADTPTQIINPGSPKGCCVEWRKGAGDIPNNLNRACYISTAENCQLQGESKGCGGEGEGCWLFFENENKYPDDGSVSNEQCRTDYCVKPI